MRERESSPSAWLYFHIPVSRTKPRLGCQNSPRSCSNAPTPPVPKNKSAGPGIPSSPSSPSSCQLWFPCGALLDGAGGGAARDPPALPWCCRAQNTPLCTTMIVLKDALGSKDVRILSVHEPNIHRPELLKESNCQARALTKISLIPNLLWDCRSEAMDGAGVLLTSGSSYSRNRAAWKVFSVLPFCPSSQHTSSLC